VTWDAQSLRTKVVDPILSAMLTPDELRTAVVDVAPGGEEGWLLLRVVVGHDELISYLYQPPVMTDWSAAEIAKELVDEMHDLIAESEFGWGQSRSAAHVVEGLERRGQSG
jgi:hypothetical protein